MEALESFVYCLLRMYVKIPVKMHPFDLLTKFHKSYVCFYGKNKKWSKNILLVLQIFNAE